MLNKSFVCILTECIKEDVNAQYDFECSHKQISSYQGLLAHSLSFWLKNIEFPEK